MSDKGSFIEVDIAELPHELPGLLRQLRQNQLHIRIVDHGKAVADLTPSLEPTVNLPFYPELANIQFNADPTLPLSDEDWPESAR